MGYIYSEHEHAVTIETEALDFRQDFSGTVAARRIVEALAQVGLSVTRIQLPTRQVLVTYDANGITGGEAK